MVQDGIVLDRTAAGAATDIADTAFPRPAEAPAAHRETTAAQTQDERPRERLLGRGPAALSDAELVALLLRSGSGGISAIDLARRLLREHGTLTALLTATPRAMARAAGLGPAKATALLAVMELARRVQMEKLDRTVLLGRPQAVKDYLGLLLRGRNQEVFVVLFLDSQNRLIQADELFQGTLNQTAVYPREVARRALELNAAAVILAHNHPSGVAEPSQADRLLTDTLRAALRHLDIPVLDHIIVAAGCSWSFAEHGQL